MAFTHVQIRTTRYGEGVFAQRAFQPGETVLSVTGQRVKRQSTHSIQIAWHEHIEPDPPAKFLNHSCDPNMGVRFNEAGLPDFVALRAIPSGEELTFDYAMTEYRLTEMSHGQHERLRCGCGALSCRGYLGNYSELPDEIRARYAGYVAPYLLTR